MTTLTGPGLGAGPLGVQPWGGGVPTGDPLPGGVGWYRVELIVGGHSYSTAYGDTPDYGVRLPLTLGWQIPDSAGYPAQADTTRMTFGILLPADADPELAGITKGSAVEFTMWTDPTPGADPWQTFSGVVTQVDATFTDAGNFRMTVYAGDNSLRLDDIMLVGYTWPQESISDRLARIAAEAGITIGFASTPDDAVLAEVRDRSGAITALAALRDTLADLASFDDSEGPTYYGKWVPGVDTSGNVTLHNFQRRWHTGSLLELDGGSVSALGGWSKLPSHPSRAAWVIVDDTVFGTPAGPPLVRRTQLVPAVGSYTDAITDLGNSLLPDGSTQLDGWFAEQVTFMSYRDPDPMGPYILGGQGLPSMYPPRFVTTVLIDNIDPAYHLLGVGSLAGVLIGAQLVIPPGGAHRVQLTLRPELLAGTDLEPVEG